MPFIGQGYRRNNPSIHLQVTVGVNRTFLLSMCKFAGGTLMAGDLVIFWNYNASTSIHTKFLDQLDCLILLPKISPKKFDRLILFSV